MPISSINLNKMLKKINDSLAEKNETIVKELNGKLDEAQVQLDEAKVKIATLEKVLNNTNVGLDKVKLDLSTKADIIKL